MKPDKIWKMTIRTVNAITALIVAVAILIAVLQN